MWKGHPPPISLRHFLPGIRCVYVDDRVGGGIDITNQNYKSTLWVTDGLVGSESYIVSYCYKHSLPFSFRVDVKNEWELGVGAFRW